MDGGSFMAGLLLGILMTLISIIVAANTIKFPAPAPAP